MHTTSSSGLAIDCWSRQLLSNAVATNLAFRQYISYIC